MQYVFGSGILIGTQLTDATGAAVSNPTPLMFGAMQDVGVDVQYDVKPLHGSNNFPLAMARGKGKVSGKARFASFNSRMLNAFFFGQTLSTGLIAAKVATAGATIPGTPYTITPSPPSSGTWDEDLGVVDASGTPYVRVASSPTTGQYSVSAGVYTFAAADADKVVYINYVYTAAAAYGNNIVVTNLPMGYMPTFKVAFHCEFQAKKALIQLPTCVSTQLSIATKQDDYTIPDFSFEAYADGPTAEVMTVSFTE